MRIAVLLYHDIWQFYETSFCGSWMWALKLTAGISGPVGQEQKPDYGFFEVGRLTG